MTNIVPLKQDNLEETIDCFSDIFTGEIMSKALKIDKDSYYPYAKINCERAINNLSLIAKNKENEVIGLMLLDDFSKSKYYSEESCDTRFNIMNNFFDKLHEWYLDYPINQGEILHLAWIGVKEEYQKKGIASLLIKQINEIAINNNYQKIIAECTGVISQYICRKRNFRTIKELNYGKYKYNGKKVFKGIINPNSCKLMLKKNTLD